MDERCESWEQAEQDFMDNLLDMGKPSYMISNIPQCRYLCDIGKCSKTVYEFWRYTNNNFITLCKEHARVARSKKRWLNFVNIVECY